MAKLPGEVLDLVQSMCDEGDEFADEGDYAAAIKRYSRALALMPEPKTAHEAAMWVLGALGDVHFLSGNFAVARDNLEMAVRCPGGDGDPILHLRLGQCEFELGYLDRAARELTRAYEGSGAKIFDDGDDKYFAFLKTRLQPPEGGW